MPTKIYFIVSENLQEVAMKAGQTLTKELNIITIHSNLEYVIERMHVEYFKLQIHGLESPLFFSLSNSVKLKNNMSSQILIVRKIKLRFEYHLQINFLIFTTTTVCMTQQK